MFAFNTSGQFLYFPLISITSGTPVTGASGSISGWRAVDGKGPIVLSGNIVEDGNGLYHANLYDWDTSGSCIGYVFSASGCAQNTFSAVTTRQVSGLICPASGSSYIASGSISSGVITSGIYVTASLTSGQQVAVYSGQLSGQPLAGLSGFVYPASGINTAATVLSGTLYLASGSIFGASFASGVLTVTIPVDIWTLNMSGLATVPTHIPVNAIRKLVNAWNTSTNSGYLTVFLEDGATTAYQQALTSQSGAAPVTALGDT